MQKKTIPIDKIKIVSFFSEDHIAIFGHKYRIDPGYLFSIQSFNIAF